VFLFMATTVVSVAIFLCGVMVGRGVRAERGEEPAVDTVAAAGVDTSVPDGETTPTPDVPLTYEEGLRASKPKPGTLKAQPEPEAPPVQQAPPPPPPAVVEDTKPALEEVSVPSSARSGTWVLQTHAVQNKASATQIVKQLLDKGYPAYLQNPAPKAPAIYRVRVGGFNDRREAENQAQRLEKELQLRPVVTRR
jgi:cell division septation protein DedD